jgi:hypothetical protein
MLDTFWGNCERSGALSQDRGMLLPHLLVVAPQRCFKQFLLVVDMNHRIGDQHIHIQTCFMASHGDLLPSNADV